MAYLLFLDESGHDLKVSPYSVLAGIAVEDRDLWNLIVALQSAESSHFGQRITPRELELKGRKLLKRKTFRLAAQLDPLPVEQRSALARQCLQRGMNARGLVGGGGSGRYELTALAQAKIAFVEYILELCARYHVHAFASVVDRDAPEPRGTFLRKDYAFLFERFYYFLEDNSPETQGLVVFDERDKTTAHLLTEQMGHYFSETETGRVRSSNVVPEPFFVHSDLTTMVQVADIVAYIIAWGLRVGNMSRSGREELRGLGDRVRALRYRTVREGSDGKEYPVWSFALIDDLRPREERF